MSSATEYRRIVAEFEKERRLRRAAPYLLKAVKTLIAGAEADGWPPGWGLVKDTALAAVAKAEGQ